MHLAHVTQFCPFSMRAPVMFRMCRTARCQTLTCESRSKRHRSIARAATAVTTSLDEDLLRPGLEYSAEWNEAYWRTRPVTVQLRLIEIGWSIAKWQLRKRLTGGEGDAAYLLTVLAELGPAFVKIGQALSTRPDVVSPEYLVQLERLQDDLPAFNSAEAFAVIEADLGRPVFDIFSTLTTAPVAAASLGQVYKGTLKTGETVAVKVQRPGVLGTFALDIFILRNLGWWFRRLAKVNSDLPGLIDEWAASVYRELSYVQELRNAEEFKALFAHYTEIYVPKMYQELSSERVLTMEWVDGKKPRSSSENLNGFSSPEDLRLVQVGVRCSLEQILQEGFYHSDPHPGNLLQMADGRLCYLDFGMVGRIDKTTRQALITATMHLTNGEYGKLSADFVKLGMLPKVAVASNDEIVRALTSVFQEAISRGVDQLSFGGLSTKLGRTMYRYKFRIPTYFTLLVRSFAILEGIALAVDPNYKVIGAAYPWVARKLLTDRSPELQNTLYSLLYDGNAMFRFKRLQSLLRQAVRSPTRPTRALPPGSERPENGAAAAMAIPGARLTTTGALELLLSDDGAFLRDIVLDELAKGIDAATRINLDAVQRAAQRHAVTAFGLEGRESSAASGELNGAWPGAGLVSALFRTGPWSDERDVEQVQGVSSLIETLRELAARGEGEGDSSWPAARGTDATALLVAETFAVLQWVVTETSSLPRDAQQRALLLPADLAGRVSSRAAARSVRLLLGAPEQPRKGTAVRSAA